MPQSLRHCVRLSAVQLKGAAGKPASGRAGGRPKPGSRRSGRTSARSIGRARVSAALWLHFRRLFGVCGDCARTQLVCAPAARPASRAACASLQASLSLSYAAAERAPDAKQPLPKTKASRGANMAVGWARARQTSSARPLQLIRITCARLAPAAAHFLRQSRRSTGGGGGGGHANLLREAGRSGRKSQNKAAHCGVRAAQVAPNNQPLPVPVCQAAARSLESTCSQRRLRSPPLDSTPLDSPFPLELAIQSLGCPAARPLGARLQWAARTIDNINLLRELMRPLPAAAKSRRPPAASGPLRRRARTNRAG